MTTEHEIRNRVRQGYGKIAALGQLDTSAAASEDDTCCAGGGCCGPTTLSADQVAIAVGYAESDLTILPEGANMGLSCGNPTALASLSAGETVLDLGSGGGFDCFIAGKKVGAHGRIIGVDMTPEMLSKARANLAAYEENSGLTNVEFRLGEIEHLPLPDGSVDVVISNCVLNLSPNKPQVWREVARVLKPGGRVAISDLALLKPLPDAVQADLEALIGCIAGAELVEDTRASVLDAGLSDLNLTATRQYVEAMVNAQDPLYQRVTRALPEGSGVADYIASLEIRARKP